MRHDTSTSADGSVKGKNEGRKRVLASGAEEAAHELADGRLEVREGDPLVHGQPFQLRKGGRVAGVVRVAPVHHPGDDHAHGRLERLHHVRLRRRGVRAQDDALGQVEGVVHVGRGVVQRRVELAEVVLDRLHLRPRHAAEAQVAEDVADLVDHQRHGCTPPCQRRRPGRVKSMRGPSSAAPEKARLALVQERGQRLLDPVGLGAHAGRSPGESSPRRRRMPVRRPLAAQVLDAQRLQRLGALAGTRGRPRRPPPPGRAAARSVLRLRSSSSIRGSACRIRIPNLAAARGLATPNGVRVTGDRLQASNAG